jgi:hypothetical protein
MPVYLWAIESLPRGLILTWIDNTSLFSNPRSHLFKEKTKYRYPAVILVSNNTQGRLKRSNMFYGAKNFSLRSFRSRSRPIINYRFMVLTEAQD